MPATHVYAGIVASKFVKAEADCRTYSQYANYLAGRSCKTIAANVHVVYDRAYAAVLVKLYNTVILRFLPGELFSAENGRGAWNTLTTVTRLTQFGPPGVTFWRKRGRLMCSRGQCGEGIFYPVFKPEPPEPEPPRIAYAPEARRRRTIRAVHP